jgi:hemolysin activation/secretion protein
MNPAAFIGKKTSTNTSLCPGCCSIHSVLLGLCLIVGLMTSEYSFAQTAADIQAAQRQAEIIQRQEQERLQKDQEEIRQRAERVDGMDTDKLQPKIEVPALGVTCRQIDTIRINASPNLPSQVRESIIAKFNHRCLNVGDIERILAEITKHYIDRGFITARAYLPPQDLSKGQLEILVVEGVVEKILLDDGNKHSVSVKNVFPGIEGNLLNLRDLEQGIDQINRLTSNNAQLDIQPGDQPGASRVVVHNQPRSPYHLNLSTDNQGSDSTGKTQTGITASADHLLGLNEMFSATHRESVPGDFQRQYSGSDTVNFSIPFGYSTLSMSTSGSRYASMIHVPSGLILIASGTNQTDNVRLDRVVYRDQTTRASLSAMLTTKQSRNYLDGQLLGVSSRNLTVFDLDSSLTTGLAGGTFTLDLGYAQGLNAMGALRDMNNLPDWAARAQFSKLKFGFNYARPFHALGIDASFTSQMTGQHTGTTLYGSEQIAIGGLYSVRGFVRNTLSGDNGYYWRNELSIRQPVSVGSEKIPTRFYVGYDTGEVKNMTANIPQGHLAGMVFGLSTNWRGVTWDFFNTRPLTLASNMTRESSQTWCRLAYSF